MDILPLEKQIEEYITKKIPLFDYTHSNRGWTYPACSFENTHQIAGISHIYKLPEKKHPEAIATEIFDILKRLKAITCAVDHFQPIKDSYIQNYLLMFRTKEIEKVRPQLLQKYHEIIKLNPDVKILQADKIYTPYVISDVILGMLSYLNPVDIYYFSVEGMNGIKSAENSLWKQNNNKIKEITHTTPRWIMSPSTQMLAIKKLEERQKENSQSSLTPSLI